MTEFNTAPMAPTATKRLQCRIEAAKRNRFWRALTNAFLMIHLVALVIVGFMVGDGWLFRLVAATIVVAPLLSYVEHLPTKEAADA